MSSKNSFQTALKMHEGAVMEERKLCDDCESMDLRHGKRQCEDCGELIHAHICNVCSAWFEATGHHCIELRGAS